MAQFYFLSVLLNIIAGLIFVYGKEFSIKDDNLNPEDGEEKNPSGKQTESFFGAMTCFDSSSFRLVVGVLSLLVGLMKILSVFRNDVPVVGDLIPALAGLLGGTALLLEYFVNNAKQKIVLPRIAQKIFIGGRKYIGVFCLVAGLLHFIFPQVILL